MRLVTVEQKIENLIDRDNDRHAENSKKLDAILEQALKTNGRVNSLEAWKDKVTGMWVALAAVGAGIVALAGIWEHFKK